MSMSKISSTYTKSASFLRNFCAVSGENCVPVLLSINQYFISYYLNSKALRLALGSCRIVNADQQNNCSRIAIGSNLCTEAPGNTSLDSSQHQYLIQTHMETLKAFREQ